MTRVLLLSTMALALFAPATASAGDSWSKDVSFTPSWDEAIKPAKETGTGRIAGPFLVLAWLGCEKPRRSHARTR